MEVVSERCTQWSHNLSDTGLPGPGLSILEVLAELNHNDQQPLFHQVAQYLSLPQLGRLMLSTKDFRLLGIQYLRHQVDELLRAYRLRDPRGFMTMMEQRDMVLAGHAVVRCLLGRAARPALSGLNIYVSDRDEVALFDYLEDNGYYVVHGNTIDIDHTLETIMGVSRIFRLACFVRCTGTYTRMNVVVTWDNLDRPRAIAFLPTSASMVYVGPRDIHVISPHRTFEDMQALYSVTYSQPRPDIISHADAGLSAAALKHVRKMRAEGFDIRWPTTVRYHAVEGECGFACASKLAATVEHPMTLPLVVAAKEEDPVLEARRLRRMDLDRLMGAEVTVNQTGKCQVTGCPSHGEGYVWCFTVFEQQNG